MNFIDYTFKKAKTKQNKKSYIIALIIFLILIILE
jgi:hypothetical protein